MVFKTALFLCSLAAAFAQAPPLVRILTEELDRNFRVLKDKGDPAPYYIAYEVTDVDAASVNATLGAVESNRRDRSRMLDLTVRVGSPKLDNYHRVRNDSARFTAGIQLPVEDNPAAIRRILWLETDRVYRAAAERLIRIKSNQELSVAAEDDSDDFSREEPATFFAPPQALNFSADQAAARVRRLSLALGKFPALLTSEVTLSAQRVTSCFVDTDGARIVHGRGFANLNFAAFAKAADGMDIAGMDGFSAEDLAGLPKDDEVLKSIERTGALTTEMLRAPVIEPYVGPAVLSGRAAAVLFHEIFGHRIEGHRQKDATEGQTFTKMVGTKILPDFLSVKFDPTRRKFEDASLNGSYAYDDEGVKAQPVTVVDQGVLKTFLLSRSPIRGFPRSNGHGRRQPGLEPVARQSNLFVESSQTVSDAKLRELLIAELKRQNKPFGLLFSQVTGGFTFTDRNSPQAYKVLPLVVYRVYADGRKDELVRGADVVGTPLASFAKILATGNRPEIFNGYCGAESGGVPVAAVSPAILFSEIEIQKKAKSDDRPPFLPSPLAGGAQ